MSSKLKWCVPNVAQTTRDSRGSRSPWRDSLGGRPSPEGLILGSVLRGLVTVVGIASLAFAIPPASGSTTVAEIRVGEGPCCVVAQGRSIWVLNVCDASVSEIDPATNTVVRTIPIGPRRRAGDPHCSHLKLIHGGGRSGSSDGAA